MTGAALGNTHLPGLRLVRTRSLRRYPRRPGQPEVPVIRSQALLERARPAKPPKPRRDLEVIRGGRIAAAGADELIHVVVAALDTAVHDAGRLSPQASDRRFR